jgi:hypothetical protein
VICGLFDWGLFDRLDLIGVYFIVLYLMGVFLIGLCLIGLY